MNKIHRKILRSAVKEPLPPEISALRHNFVSRLFSVFNMAVSLNYDVTFLMLAFVRL